MVNDVTRKPSLHSEHLSFPAKFVFVNEQKHSRKTIKHLEDNPHQQASPNTNRLESPYLQLITGLSDANIPAIPQTFFLQAFFRWDLSFKFCYLQQQWWWGLSSSWTAPPHRQPTLKPTSLIQIAQPCAYFSRGSFNDWLISYLWNEYCNWLV